MISKKYFFILILILLVTGSIAYVGISGFSSINYISDSEKDSLLGGAIKENLNNTSINLARAGGSSSGDSSYSLGISGLAGLASVQNSNSPGIFLFQGFIGEDFEFSIEPANVENETEQQDSEYRAEFFDSQENLIKSFNFSADEIEYSDYKMFYFFTEVPLNTGKIFFYDNQEILSEFIISESSPVVSDIEIDEVEENEFEISWQAEDADGDNLVFSVLISNGSESYIVGDLIEDNFFVLKTDFVMGGSYGIIVRAFDGFNFGYGESDFFSVNSKKPYIMVFGIANNSEIILSQEIYASASGFDLDDGFLNSFLWRLNGEYVGSEDSIVLSNLSLGEYELTLESEDSDGNTGIESVKFFVVERVKFRTSNPSYAANTKISVNLNCNSENLEVYSTKLWVVGQKSCGDLYDEPEYLAIENMPYSGGMLGGLWECSSELNLYEYSKGYYVCCMNSDNNSLMRPFNILENKTEKSDPLNCVRGNNWCGNADINRDGEIDSNDYDIIDRIWLFYRDATCSFTNNWCSRSDINHDGSIDSNDYDILDRNFLFRDDFGECVPSSGHCLNEVDSTREVLC